MFSLWGWYVFIWHHIRHIKELWWWNLYVLITLRDPEIDGLFFVKLISQELVVEKEWWHHIPSDYGLSNCHENGIFEISQFVIFYFSTTFDGSDLKYLFTILICHHSELVTYCLTGFLLCFNDAKPPLLFFNSTHCINNTSYRGVRTYLFTIYSCC